MSLIIKSIFKKKIIFRYSFAVLLFLGAAFAFRSFQQNWNLSLKSALSDLNGLLLLVSVLMIVLQIIAMGVSWSKINQRLEVGDISFYIYMKAFILGIPARYVPGKVASYLTRAYLIDGTKISKKRLAVGYGYEAAFQLMAGLMLSVFVFLYGLGGSEKLIYVYMILFVCAISVFAFWDKPLRIFITLYEKFRGKETETVFTAIKPLDAVKIFIINIFSVLLSGVWFFFCINTFFEFPIENIFAAIGISALSGLIGALVFFMPSGIGVREGGIVCL